MFEDDAKLVLLAGGTSSNIYYRKGDEGEYIIKTYSKDNFNDFFLRFQDKVSEIFINNFRINKIIKNNDGRLYKKGHSKMLVCYEFISEHKIGIDLRFLRVCGCNMGKMHNFAYENNDTIMGTIKSETYNSMSGWNKVPKSDYSMPSFDARQEIFQALKPFNINQPRIMLHRDFRLHNILSDGKWYYLIDFDFAAKDFCTIEIGAFITDLLELNDEAIAAFMESYITHNNFLDRNAYNNIANDYLNYLCTNTFPFYMEKKMTRKVFENLVNERNTRLMTLARNWSRVQDIIEELL